MTNHSDSISSNTANIPSLETKLDSVHFGNTFDKLIQKLKNSCASSEYNFLEDNKLVDIINLTLEDLQKLPRVDDKDIELWYKLKLLYKNDISMQPPMISVVINGSKVKLPSLETKLDDIHFGNKFDKLVLKIKNSCSNYDSNFLANNNMADIINLTRKDLLQLPRVGVRYIKLWHDLKLLYNGEFNTQPLVISVVINGSKVEIPSPETAMDDVYFGNKFDRLISKFLNTCNNSDHNIFVSNKLADILNLSRGYLFKIPRFGEQHIYLWDELKALYENSNNSRELALAGDSKYEFDFDGMAINYCTLNAIERKRLEYFYELTGTRNILDIVNFQVLEFKKNHKVMDKFLNTIDSIKERLNLELRNIASGKIDYKKMESDLLISTRFKSFSIEQIYAILLEDIDKFLDSIDDNDRLIFKHRWGFIEKELSVPQIHLKYNIRKGRVRHREAEVSKMLAKSLRITQENIWLNLKANINFRLHLKMEKLYSCFHNKESNFYKFLDYICGYKNINDILKPKIPKDILNYFFAKNGYPISVDDVKKYIEKRILNNFSLGGGSIDNILEYLEKLKIIEIKDGNVYPKYLRKHEAAACVLRKIPQGLTWLEVVKVANAEGMAKSVLNEGNLDCSFQDSEILYLAGKGIYKHAKYIDYSKIDIGGIFRVLTEFFDKTNREAFHLNEIYYKSKFLQKNEYYIIRYIVKLYGEGYGFYFDGKSRTDSIGMKKSFKRVTQKKVILNAMNSNKKSITRSEIAGLLKSKNTNHAGYYLDSMIKDNQVVQNDCGLFTTPEIAFKNIDLPSLAAGINEILCNENKPVHFSIFYEKLNKKLKQAYSKYLYLAIVIYCSQSNNWYRKQKLYSLNEIKYDSVKNAIEKHCSKDFDIDTNFKILSKFITITLEDARPSINQYIKTSKPLRSLN